jgi:probable rRNA maturation factor
MGRRSARTRDSRSPRGEGNRVLTDATRGGPGALAHARALRKLAGRFLAELKLENVELSLALVRDPAIRRLNRTWRGKDQPTDVLSFPAGDSSAPGVRPLGDVIISMDTARRAAKTFRTTLSQELARYLAHGLLHLLGYDHDVPAAAQKMERLERRLLGHAGLLARSDELGRPLSGALTPGGKGATCNALQPAVRRA